MVTDSLSVSQTPLNTKWLDGILKRQTEYVSLLMTFTKLLEKFLSKKKVSVVYLQKCQFLEGLLRN
jgi:hypothetical protein